ncbi:hypothetical protein C8F04DRAFT_1275979 [Mycena alexandri]|uniref:CxC2-like cysteine cluster KDZ transposase-associated domain-containing protein n=2 Tax=Mycena alexandri TaxID=1745969 RepID=A0AAD6S1U3_9AGAR|nr:hypothetical protein C8F04DRAFT_1275979 [Mycena alexandri]
MKRLGGAKLKRNGNTATRTPRLAPSVASFGVTFHTGDNPKFEARYVPNAQLPVLQTSEAEEPSLPFLDAPATFLDTPEEGQSETPAYEATRPTAEKTKQTRQNVAHMNALRAKEPEFLKILLSLHHRAQLLTQCGCGKEGRLRKVACNDCIQAELLCRQCWVNKHRHMPTHWAFVWNRHDRFFEKHDFSRVMSNGAIGLGHSGEWCPNADVGQSFTLVDLNGIHATCLAFCRCTGPEGDAGKPEFEQLLGAGIFPGSTDKPRTGYTMGMLQYHRQQRSQGKGSAYNFVLVPQRMADPFFAANGAVPEIYANFLAITRFYENLQVIIESGAAHGLDIPLPGEVEHPYPNRPQRYLGANCAACPERGVNMPLAVNAPRYLRHTISKDITLDGNFKANLFFKRDDGSDTALTDGKMYFPDQNVFDRIVKTYVVPDEDKEVPCKAHIGSIRHQGRTKYGHTALSGVVGGACGHAVLGSLVDMPNGEAFALGTVAQHELLRHTNSPPLPPESATPVNQSYDSYCSFVKNQLKRAVDLFPEEEWLHTLLNSIEGQIPANHINGHGVECQTIWQAVYFPCRAHFHGETAEVLWAFLNPLGSSTRQMTVGARHDTINYVMHAWNMLKVVNQANLLAAERLDALQLFELHMAVVVDLSKQHATEVGAWSRKPRVASVYQHETTKVLTIESMLATMIAAEREKSKRDDQHEAATPVAQWIHDGIKIEREQALTMALLENHRDHELQDTWATITTLRDKLNNDLKRFREQQLNIYLTLKLSALDIDEPEFT